MPSSWNTEDVGDISLLVCTGEAGNIALAGTLSMNALFDMSTFKK